MSGPFGTLRIAALYHANQISDQVNRFGDGLLALGSFGKSDQSLPHDLRIGDTFVAGNARDALPRLIIDPNGKRRRHSTIIAYYILYYNLEGFQVVVN
jgi:hypothetical protein